MTAYVFSSLAVTLAAAALLLLAACSASSPAPSHAAPSGDGLEREALAFSGAHTQAQVAQLFRYFACAVRGRVVVTAYVFTNLAAVQALAPIVDAAEGYPRAGRNVGGGVHVEPPFVTKTYAQARKQPTLAKWAYPADAVTNAALAAHASALSLPAPVALDGTWTPATSTGALV